MLFIAATILSFGHSGSLRSNHSAIFCGSLEGIHPWLKALLSSLKKPFEGVSWKYILKLLGRWTSALPNALPVRAAAVCHCPPAPYSLLQGNWGCGRWPGWFFSIMLGGTFQYGLKTTWFRVAVKHHGVVAHSSYHHHHVKFCFSPSNTCSINSGMFTMIRLPSGFVASSAYGPYSAVSAPPVYLGTFMSLPGREWWYRLVL